MELPYYTFDEHFRRPYRSFLARHEVWDYLNGAWTKQNLSSYITFNTAVRYVKYNPDTDDFRIAYTDLTNEVTSEETFTHIIVASGIFHIPNKPDFPGLAEFNGNVIHAHDIREIKLYKGQSVLLIGNGFTSTDIALMGVKYGAKNMTISWRTKPAPIQWPEGICVRPMVAKIERRIVHFVDGSSDEFDSIILCTGYQVKYPFMDKDLCLEQERSYYKRSLYKGLVFIRGGNNKLFYIGANIHLPSLLLFDVQSLWICRFIQGTLAEEPASKEDMIKDIDKWIKKAPEFAGDVKEGIVFNFTYVGHLASILEYNIPTKELLKLLLQHLINIVRDPLGCRDICFRSAYTGTLAAAPDVAWLRNMIDYV